MTLHASAAASPPSRARQIARAVGRRNVAYVGGTMVLFALALLVEQLTYGNDRGAGVMGGMILWIAGSALFLGINVLLIGGWVIDQIKGGVPMIAAPVSRALIG